jgi:hypothetical protein
VVVRGILHRHRDHAGEIAARQHPHPRVQVDADAVEVPQHLGVRVGDPGDHARLAVHTHRQLARVRRGDAPVGGRDGVAVRVASGVAQLGVDPVEHGVRDRVLEDFGLVVHLVPAVPELVDQERLHEPMPAHHRQRGEAPVRGQRDRAVLGVVDEALVGELADGLRGRTGRHSEALGEQLGADLLVRPLLGRPDHFQIVLRHRRKVAGVTVRTHADQV